MLTDEAGDAVLHHLQVLDDAHLALIIGQGAELALAQPGDAGGQGLHHVAEALEGHAGLVNGPHVGQVNCAAAPDGFGKGIGGSAQDSGGQLFAGARGRGVSGQVIAHRGNPFSELPGPEVVDLPGGGLDEPAFAALKPGAQQFEFREPGSVLAEESELDLGVAEVAQGRQAAFEDAARLFERGAGHNTAEQRELGQQPPGGHAQFMHCIVGRLLLAVPELLAVRLPALAHGLSEARADR